MPSREHPRLSGFRPDHRRPPMDQQELRKLEQQCIQEQPPWCTATCPLHVDVRGFLRHAASGAWDEAWKVLHRTLPLPSVLGRICDAPCRAACKRSEAGEAIEVGALERVCVNQPPPRLRIQPLPSRDGSVAVVGGGLAGLTAAWDLSRKGYRVDLFDPDANPGARLLERHPDLLAEAVLEAELEVMERLGVTFHAKHPVNRPDFIATCRDTHDAVFLSLEAADLICWGVEVDAEGNPVLAPPVQSAGLEGVFAGGLAESPVLQAAEGRWGATSVDRFLQKVSLTAGREKEGPHGTALFTSLEGVPPLPAVPCSSPDGLYSLEEARAEASRCLQCVCLECVKVCPYLERFKGYPKKYAREIYNNESIVMGSRLANKLINSCRLCGLCEVVCPEDFAMQDLCLQARRSMVRRRKMPPSAHEFALLDMAFSQSERFFLARHEPERMQSAFAFFPGCQLSATQPDQAARAYAHLRGNLEGGVGLVLGCCGAPAHWAGQEEACAWEAERLRRIWRDLGRPTLIAACSTCLRMFEDHLPEVDAISLWAVWTGEASPEIRFHPANPPALHDPCTTWDRPEVQASVRGMLAHAGISFEELPLGRGRTECCGFGGLMLNANPDLAQEVVHRRADQSESDYLAYCAMCRDRLASTGKRVLHLLDLFFPPEGGDPASRPKVGWSERQENRARLRERLRRELWNEETKEMEAHQAIRLIISDEARELLDRRRILVEDIQRVIHHAEETGDRLLHPETGRYKASFKPYKATFWVEYTPRDDAFEIHNAYAHRMEVVGGGRL